MLTQTIDSNKVGRVEIPQERRKDMNENSAKDKEAQTPSSETEWHLDVSREQYEDAKAKGFDEETLFKPGRHAFRRRVKRKIQANSRSADVSSASAFRAQRD